MGELYEELVQSIDQSDIKDRVESIFIDLSAVDSSKYGQIKQILDRGFKMPVVALNGNAIFAGGIESESILAAVRKSLQ